jgi:hypothetical protein
MCTEHCQNLPIAYSPLPVFPASVGLQGLYLNHLAPPFLVTLIELEFVREKLIKSINVNCDFLLII